MFSAPSFVFASVVILRCKISLLAGHVCFEGWLRKGAAGGGVDPRLFEFRFDIMLEYDFNDERPAPFFTSVVTCACNVAA